MDTEYCKRKVQEAESDTITCLGRGDISILSALHMQLPDVFTCEILPKLGLKDKLSLAQVSKTYRDTVWSVDGVRSIEYPKDLVIKMAAKYGNLPAVRALLQSGVEPGLTFGTGLDGLGFPERPDLIRTPLMLAAACGHTPVIMELIRAGANVNTVTRLLPHGLAGTALLDAVLHGHEACVLALIHAGADVHCPGRTWEWLTQSNQTASAGAKHNIIELIRYAASRNFLLLELDSV
jgi:hypothetical protein